MPNLGNNLHALADNGYTHIQKLTPTMKQELHCTEHALSKEKCEHKGQAFSVLQGDEEGTIVRAQQSVYTVQCQDSKYSVTSVVTRQRDVSDKEDAHGIMEAMFIARDPGDAFNLLHLDHLLSLEDALYSPRDFQQGPSYGLESMLDSKGNELNVFNPSHITLSLHNVSDVNARQLYRYINNTYLNIVHDCERICIHSTLGNDAGFRHVGDIERDGIMCAQKLSAHRGPHVPQAYRAAHTVAISQHVESYTDTPQCAACPQRSDSIYAVLGVCATGIIVYIGGISAVALGTYKCKQQLNKRRNSTHAKQYKEAQKNGSFFKKSMTKIKNALFGIHRVQDNTYDNSDAAMV